MSIHDKLERYLGEELRRKLDLENKSDIVSSPPSQFYVEPTNICNHDCIMCAPKSQRGKPGYMKMETWRRIVDNLYINGYMPPTTMIGRGEPLLHKNIATMVDYGSRHDIPCFIITNGSLLDESMIKALLEIQDDKLETDAADALAVAFCHINTRSFQSQYVE